MTPSSPRWHCAAWCASPVPKPSITTGPVLWRGARRSSSGRTRHRQVRATPPRGHGGDGRRTHRSPATASLCRADQQARCRSSRGRRRRGGPELQRPVAGTDTTFPSVLLCPW
jgi:hypothetical protein